MGSGSLSFAEGAGGRGLGFSDADSGEVFLVLGSLEPDVLDCGFGLVSAESSDRLVGRFLLRVGGSLSGSVLFGAGDLADSGFCEVFLVLISSGEFLDSGSEAEFFTTRGLLFISDWPGSGGLGSFARAEVSEFSNWGGEGISDSRSQKSSSSSWGVFFETGLLGLAMR